MKQVFNSLKGIVVKEVPEPSIKEGFVKIKVAYSCISAGTELSSVKGADKNILSKIIEDPGKIAKVWDIVKTQGIEKAKNKVDSTLEKLSPLGYSVSGEVIEVAQGIDNIKVGDLVAAAGGGFAVHAEVVVVPKNLVVKIPKGVNLLSAATGTIGSIAMQGVRRAGLTLGEYGVVLGSGLIGLLTAQILKASGVKVACVDINDFRLQLTKEMGVDLIINSLNEDPVNSVLNWTSGHGADAVIFTAATNQDEPLSQAFNMCRKKGRVVLVGVSGMNIKREDIYSKELDFMVSTSYGPGRYDENYEIKGNDYPYAYVRWTENRNMTSFLELIKESKVDLNKISSKTYLIDEAAQAYEGLKNDPDNHILTMLDYTKQQEIVTHKNAVIVNTHTKINKNKICIGFVGAGNFATGILLPIIKRNNDKFYLKTIVNSSGDKAYNTANLFKAEIASTDTNVIFEDPEIDLVVICTRHDSHAKLVLNALKKGKHVYVEKPLATTLEELEMIQNFYHEGISQPKPVLMVGFNRRFSIYAQELKKALNKRNSPVLLRYRMNAGFVPEDNWVHNDGGRIVGEACHIIDLMQYLTDSKIASYAVQHFKPQSGMYLAEDNRSISLSFKDGSLAVIDYFSCGNKNLPKEYLEVHFEGKSIIMDDYKSLTGYGIKVQSHKSASSQKGHNEEWLALYDSLKKGESPIPLDCLFETTRISIMASK